jgi:hypothetical protein
MSPKNAKIGSAIAMCEAPAYGAPTPSADFSLVGDIELANATWGYSYGGFQIRSLREQKGTGLFRDEDLLLDPVFNCMSAQTIHDDGGWKQWSTFVSGQYKAYLQDMFPPPPNTYVVLAGDTISGIAASLGIDWEDLARINNIHSPYTIYIGQYLLLP